MTVTDNQLAIDSSLPLEAAPLVMPGMAVAIDEQALGINATGTVARVADVPGTHGVDGYHIYFEVRVDETSSPLQGFSLRLTIPIKSSKGAVIAVPILLIPQLLFSKLLLMEAVERSVPKTIHRLTLTKWCYDALQAAGNDIKWLEQFAAWLVPSLWAAALLALAAAKLRLDDK